MSRIEVIAQRGAAPDAVIGARSWQDHGKAVWAGSLMSHHHWIAAARILGAGDARFDPELTARWGCLVACTAEFSRFWRGREDRPAASFFLEVGA